jgi:hypothetical protein
LKKREKNGAKKPNEAGMSLKTQVEKMSRSSSFSPFQDVYENKRSYTLLSKMFMKRKVVRRIRPFCHGVVGPSAHLVIGSFHHRAFGYGQDVSLSQTYVSWSL